ncbi:hypothetical protein FQN53_003409 [Emmonsiellopsis sp. PD_33]|nr:hypothetical protein FQN53_003409 [Emmonsiellopsis sp. PD_33]
MAPFQIFSEFLCRGVPPPDALIPTPRSTRKGQLWMSMDEGAGRTKARPNPHIRLTFTYSADAQNAMMNLLLAKFREYDSRESQLRGSLILRMDLFYTCEMKELCDVSRYAPG